MLFRSGPSRTPDGDAGESQAVESEAVESEAVESEAVESGAVESESVESEGVAAADESDQGTPDGTSNRSNRQDRTLGDRAATGR